MDEPEEVVESTPTAPDPDEPRLFDVAQDFNKIPARTPEGAPIEVAVSFPTDAQWVERKRKTRILHQQLGRGYTKTQSLADPKTDLKIYEAIRRNGAESLDGDEAGILLDRLQKADTIEVTWDGSGAVVLLSVPHGITVSHTFTAVPNAKQVRKLREESAVLRQLPNNTIETKLHLDAGVRLWQKCGGASQSYLNGIIPALHKDAAIRAVITKHDEEMEAAFQESEDF
jgi:hypothetical protein